MLTLANKCECKNILETQVMFRSATYVSGLRRLFSSLYNYSSLKAEVT